MGKRIKKGTRGEAAAFMTRSMALRRLQLSLKEFRRLCILKGIFPKDPKKKFKGMNKTYYNVKDITFLSHERLLQKFRDIQSYEKKIKKAKMKNEKFDVKKLIEQKPTYSIDHILKERYPRFADALGDLDDALCLINLFANVPKSELLKINSETIQMCQRLSKEFYLYCAIAQNFKKGFISIKGIYINIEIMGTEVTWLTPFNYSQKLTYEVDYSIMLDFLELYTSLLRFVNLKLFKDIGLEYPPPTENIDLPFFGFSSFDIRSIQQGLSSKAGAEKTNISEELLNNNAELKRIMDNEEENKRLKSLFKNIVFFVGREVPSELFGLAIMSCGGVYGSDEENSPLKSDDPRITHYIVDRPAELISMQENKEYIQPQWILDSINLKRLLPVAEYQPGKKLPPHLSPFYEYNDQGEFRPKKSINVDIATEEKQVEQEAATEDKELKEMLLSKNKRKLLEKIREEKMKKKRPVKKQETAK